MRQLADRPFVVVNPLGSAWSVRFKTEGAAWGRLTALKGHKDTEKNRKLLREQGWKVNRT